MTKIILSALLFLSFGAFAEGDHDDGAMPGMEETTDAGMGGDTATHEEDATKAKKAAKGAKKDAHKAMKKAKKKAGEHDGH
ncbi:MAG: hypothetical protein AB7F86_02390 [Bdellovibrionales bacterium]